MITLEKAVADLYQIAVIEGKRTSTLRLGSLADLCVQELERRHVFGAEKEVLVPGIGRDKQWDVAWKNGDKVRLSISLKSILSNIAGTVPNRADDLMGEMANVQLHSPEIVTGYVMVFATQSGERRDGKRWVEVFRSYVERLSGRQAPAWAAGMVESASIVEVDFSSGPLLLTPPTLDEFFDRLVQQLKFRNPGAIPFESGN
ncbi:MAG: hypothetical protein OXF63_08255 [Anaerolineaceae bacterium]|nr:hypothetical protein [Anaerolineaceae bacterium]